LSELQKQFDGTGDETLDFRIEAGNLRLIVIPIIMLLRITQC